MVDASCLYEVVADAPAAETVRRRLALEDDHAAPHLIDAEVLGLVRSHHRRGLLDATAAAQAVDDLAAWPGERLGHRPFLARAWELRESVRSWDALCVAVAEALGATLITSTAALHRHRPAVRHRDRVVTGRRRRGRTGRRRTALVIPPAGAA